MESKKRKKTKEKLYFSEKERAELRATIPARTGESNFELCAEFALRAEKDPEAERGHPAGLCYDRYTKLVGVKGYRLSEDQADEFELFFVKVMRTLKKCTKKEAETIWDFLLYGGKNPWDKAQSGKKEK